MSLRILVTSGGGDCWAWSIDILVFPSATGCMLTSFAFSSMIWGTFHRLLQNQWSAIFLKSWASTGYISNSTSSSSVSSGQFSPVIACHPLSTHLPSWVCVCPCCKHFQLHKQTWSSGWIRMHLPWLKFAKLEDCQFKFWTRRVTTCKSLKKLRWKFSFSSSDHIHPPIVFTVEPWGLIALGVSKPKSMTKLALTMEFGGFVFLPDNKEKKDIKSIYTTKLYLRVGII